MKKIAHSRSFYGIINWPARQRLELPAGDEERRPVELAGEADRLTAAGLRGAARDRRR